MSEVNYSVCWDNAHNLLNSIKDKMYRFNGSTVVITGPTGVIGSQVVRAFLCAIDELKINIKLILLARNTEKCRELFNVDSMSVIEWRLGEEPSIDCAYDLIVHTACVTSSEFFTTHPVETSFDIYYGTYCLLNNAYKNRCKAFINLSTMEVYGETTVKPAKETDLGYIDPTNPRNSYPLAKLLCENLCQSFCEEYGIRAVSLRLAQSFGAGVNPNDRRVFAEFARSALEGKDIVLLSDGSKKCSYVSINDVVSAIVCVAVAQSACGTYNVSNPDTYCSILEMAQEVLAKFGKPGACVRFAVDESRSKSFRAGSDILLDVSKMRKLGWHATETLEMMYSNLIFSWK